MNTRTLFCCCLFAATVGRAETTSPKFDEVYQLLRDNLKGVTPAELDQAAIKGLIEQLPGKVMLVPAGSNGAPASAHDILGKTAIFDDFFAYIRIDNVEGDLAQKLRAAYDHLAETNKSKIKGLVLDLRFAGGGDFSAAATTADCFINADQPLLNWGSGSGSATKKPNAISVPVAILVNSDTHGAAEGLAAAMREANIGLILGTPTAGQANTFKEFPLSDGEKLRVASTPVKLGDDTPLAQAIKPDIAVENSLADEKVYLENPYNLAHTPVAASKTVSIKQPAHRTMNEAELVRERKAGESSDDESDLTDGSAAASEPAQPVLVDAALARALDLLKGLSVVQQVRPG